MSLEPAIARLERVCERLERLEVRAPRNAVPANPS